MSSRWPVTHVFRSTASDLLAALTEAEQQRENFRSTCDTWAEQNPLDEHQREYQVRYDGVTLNQWFAGYDYRDGDDTTYRRKVSEAPRPGWKFNRRIGCWTPDPRTQAGKDLARSMPYVRGAAAIAERMTALPSMIVVGSNGNGGFSCTSADITVAEGIATAACPGDPFARWNGKTDLFSSYWTPVKLSEYYAEKGL